MTDEIDLDDIETESESETGNDGDWLWRDDADQSQPEQSDSPEAETRAARNADPGGGSTTDEDGGSGAVPHVPHENKDRPAGIPVEGGGSGGGAGRSADPEAAQPEASEADSQQASGPHGGDADDMTLALTYEAAKRLENPAYVFADAAEWADWLGLVGDVPAHVINRFQREHTIDVDFFSGSGTGPTERLAEINRHSMFYAERFVLVGVPEEAGWTPDGWEFLPLEDAAEKAEWQVE
ncbi:hypothetical protein KY092_00050 [Natronomonas gomsonensis]|jgi:hypothetical protein|uniref:DUF7124 domain-containing protein n=1 Tax=Natronomonas gomsonensis TaxID=1046043 RepID=UPI0020CA7AC5|nr:hypothetical protein [Natronomonas gomsonensis]MCY4728943.1 hypothetical protein [Natronomonas gomsonensis]